MFCIVNTRVYNGVSVILYHDEAACFGQPSCLFYSQAAQVIICSGYMSLAKNLNQFKDLGIIPIDLDVEKLDEGIGIQETLMIYSAKRHKTAALNLINKLFS